LTESYLALSYLLPQPIVTIKSHNGKSRCRQYRFQKCSHYEFITSHWHLLRLHARLHPCIHDVSGQRDAAEQKCCWQVTSFPA